MKKKSSLPIFLDPLDHSTFDELVRTQEVRRALRKVLRKYLKESRDLHVSRKYNLRFSSGQPEEFRSGYYGMYFEGTHAIVLCYRKRPLAHIGFNIEVSMTNRTIVVLQIQGVSFSKTENLPLGDIEEARHALGRIEWAEALVGMVLALAKRVPCIEAVSILRAQRNFYYKEGTSQAQRLRRHYNQTAHHFDFNLDRYGRWYTLTIKDRSS